MSRSIDNWIYKTTIESGDSPLLETGSGGRRITSANFFTALETEGFRKNNSRAVNITEKTAAYTATVSDEIILADMSGGAFTITLPPAASMYNSTALTTLLLTIKVSTPHATNVLTVDGNASETIDGSANIAYTANEYESRTFFSDGTNIFLLDVE